MSSDISAVPALTDQQDEDPKCPAVYDDENGDWFWIEGHDLTDEQTLIALALHLGCEWSHGGLDDAWALFREGVEVQRLHYRFRSEGDDELGTLCAADDDGARPFIRIEVST
jgi:hypothetical protein